jgi:hypothetical protein
VILEWLVLAEGLAQDAKGAFTLVSVNQNILGAEGLPTMTKRAVLAHLSVDADEEIAAGTYTFSFQVASPSGRVLHASNGAVELIQPRFPDLPGTFDIPAEAVLRITEYGAHTFAFEVSGPSGESASAEVLLHVIEQPAGA